MKTKAKAARIGQVIYWLEDHSSQWMRQGAPVECSGRVIALASDGKTPVVQSHYDGEPMVLTRWTRIPKQLRRHLRQGRRRSKIVGGRRRK